LEETKIGQLTDPLNDRTRQPMPAGGLFSTADDLARFCRMVLNGGVFEGKRLVSEASVRAMTRRQTPTTIKEHYGLGWATGGDAFGHGGAYATHMSIEPKHALVVIWLVQHAGFPGDGAKAQGAFRQAALKAFGK
jgi:CubicO group peptidase (beta-lactamase class C family)